MKKPVFKRDPLATNFLVAIIAFSSLITLASTALQLRSDYVYMVSSLHSTFAEIETGHLDTLKDSVWLLDEKQINSHLLGLTERRDIVKASITIGDQERWTAGVSIQGRKMTANFPLKQLHRKELLQIAVLNVTGSIDAIYQRLINKATVILLSNGIKTFIVGLFVYFLFQTWIARHLTKMADFADAFKPGELSGMLTLDRTPNSKEKQDDLDHMVNAFNRMQISIKASYDALSNSEEKYRSIFENAAEGIFQSTTDGQLVSANPAMAHILNYTSPEELISEITDMGRQLYLNQSDRDKCVEQLMIKGKFDAKEMQWKRKGGLPLWVLVSGRTFENSNGDQFLEGTIQDISIRKEAEIALRESQEHLSMVMQASNAGFWIRDIPSNKVIWSEGNYRLLGYEPDEIEASYEHWVMRIHPSDRERVVAVIKNAMDSHIEINMEYRVVHSDGQIRWIKNIGKTLFDANGTPTVTCGIQIDVAHRKELEKQLRTSQKLEAIGQLTGGIAHDFNNILGIIHGNFEILQRMLPDNKKALGRIKTGLKGAERGEEITRKLLNFSTTITDEKKIVKINEFIREMADLISKSLTVKIEVNFEFDEDIWLVDIDPGDFQDVLINLALNARDAMPDGGNLKIESHNKVLDEKYSQRNPQAASGEFVMLSVGDTGHGMTAEVKERVCEPFFTTKEHGKGTGLGLSMVYGFLQRSGGHLKIYSEPDEGTTFCLYLPRATDATQSQEICYDKISDLPRGTETILIVDDEIGLRNVAVFYLEELGYKTVVAKDGQHALEVLKSTTNIDLLFSDVVMPGGLDGYQLSLAVHEQYPEIKILLTSGFTKKPAELSNHDVGYLVTLDNELLRKPYNQPELSTAIRRILDKSENCDVATEAPEIK